MYSLLTGIFELNLQGETQKMADALKKSGGGCPVDHTKLQGGCPSAAGRGGDDKLNPHNLMPANAKQLPHPDQDFELPTDRIVSSIPRQDDQKWVYPSPQMFYNAVKKKGGDADEESMQEVVTIHNRVNEYCWGLIRKWESLNGNKEPKLVHFKGRYNDLSPKARLCMFLGLIEFFFFIFIFHFFNLIFFKSWPRPFDRHDWIVDRNGKQVRYVIDYYESGKANDQLKGLDVVLDVRPALDSFGSWIDRVKMLFNFSK